MSLESATKSEKPISDERGFSPLVRISLEDDDVSMESAYVENWDDHVIDTYIKDLLREKRAGHIIPSDAIAHMGFFYNTLNMGHRTENPFDKVEEYPAFHYKETEFSETLINIYKRIIIPMHPLYGP